MENRVEEIINHIKAALGPVKWEEGKFCKDCHFELVKGEVEYCEECSISD